LRQTCRPALSSREHLAATGHASQNGLNSRINRLGQTIGHLVMQIGTVNEMLLNAQV
jgi:hypothetical protein